MTELPLAAVVATHEPSPEYRDLVAVLRESGATVIVVDDGSRRTLDPGPGVEWVRLQQNRGLAAALNHGLRRARLLGATHVVTFDQDSMVAAQYLANLRGAWDDCRRYGLHPGVVGPGHVSPLSYRGRAVGPYLLTAEVVQSGAMFCLQQLEEIGDFDEQLWIDGVDADACLRLQDHGYDVVCAPLRMRHRLGAAVELSVGERRVLLTRHPPARQYYIVRNRLLLVRRNLLRRPAWAVRTLRKAAVGAGITVLLDEGRARNASAITRGVWHAACNRDGQWVLSERRARWRRP